eukprot:8778059-Pyramimonas_sp.AAC.2
MEGLCCGIASSGRVWPEQKQVCHLVTPSGADQAEPTRQQSREDQRWQRRSLDGAASTVQAFRIPLTSCLLYQSIETCVCDGGSA